MQNMFKVTNISWKTIVWKTRPDPIYFTALTRAVNGTRVPTGNTTTWVMKMVPGYPFKAPGTRLVSVSGYPGSKMCTLNSSSSYPSIIV